MNNNNNNSNKKKAAMILGQDVNVLIAVASNVVSWFVRRFFPTNNKYYLKYLLLPKIDIEEDDQDDQEEASSSTSNENENENQQTKCIAIGRPGGIEQLRLITLKPGFVTCGYNVVKKQQKNGDNNNKSSSSSSPLFIDASSDNEKNVPRNSVIVKVHAFSINYADCCIRWGLYESANQFVGYPIVPGFDVSGIVERVINVDDDNDSTTTDDDSSSVQLKVGDKVYGATFFGGYSTKVLVPMNQLRKVPNGKISLEEAAALPAVSLTALYSLYLGGFFYPSAEPSTSTTQPPSSSNSNKSILIHSCAGGVGSMMVQMSKILNLGPIVGVVGRTNKVKTAKVLGCDVVIDKSTENLWESAKNALLVVEEEDSISRSSQNQNNNNNNADGYAMIADANGISTMNDSHQHLAPTGRLVVFGFHSNLPMGTDMLHPLEWLKMIYRQFNMPKFDPMDMVSTNKSVLGFNLSFFVNEIDLLSKLYNQITDWLSEGKLKCPTIVVMDMKTQIADAHELIQSGKSIGKIVMKT